MAQNLVAALQLLADRIGLHPEQRELFDLHLGIEKPKVVPSFPTADAGVPGPVINPSPVVEPVEDETPAV